MWLLAGSAGIVIIAGAFGMLAIAGRKQPCPCCGERALQLVATRSMFVAGEGASLERMYRCRACKVELMRRGKGAMIRRELWDRGERAELPPARLLDR